jgi:hypothetical protein
MPKPKSFTAWLKSHADHRTAIGDLARDVSHDPDWPADEGRQGQLDYLEERGAIDAAIGSRNLFGTSEVNKQPQRRTTNDRPRPGQVR